MNVRAMAKRTAVLLVLFAAVILLLFAGSGQLSPASAAFLDDLQAVFSGFAYQPLLMNSALLLLLIAGVTDVVLRGNDRFRLISSFPFLLLFPLLLLFWYRSELYARLNSVWLAQFCAASLALLLRFRFSGLTRIAGSGSKWALPFLIGGPPKNGTSANSRGDLCFLYYLRMAMLTVCVLLAVSAAIYWSDHRAELARIL